MPEFYLRASDPFSPVYEVDHDAQTWKLVASSFGVLDVGGSISSDGGAMFKSAKFTQVWKKAEGDGTVTFTRDQPLSE
jgi:hypothetical protein